jgi:hypothetical protein
MANRRDGFVGCREAVCRAGGESSLRDPSRDRLPAKQPDGPAAGSLDLLGLVKLEREVE